MLYLILISNLFPLYGLFYLGWSPFNTVLIFAIETILMLFLFEARLLVNGLKGALNIFLAIFIGIFTAIVVSIFTGAQVLLSTIMFAVAKNSLSWLEIKIIFLGAFAATFSGIIIMALRYLIELIKNIANNTFIIKNINELKNNQKEIIIRIFLMQATVLIGGVIGKMSGNIQLGVSLLILLNTLFSVSAYLKAQKKLLRVQKLD